MPAEKMFGFTAQEMQNIFKKLHTIVLIGPPGAGKDTEAEVLLGLMKKWSPEIPIDYLCTGDIFREALPKFSPVIREKFNEIQAAGQLQPGIIASALWASKILFETRGGHILINGSPRALDEAENMIDFYYHVLGRALKIFLLQISDAESEERMVKRNLHMAENNIKVRVDTKTPESRKAKRDFYHKHTVPALEYLYNVKGAEVLTVSSSEEKDSVTRSILSLLDTYQ